VLRSSRGSRSEGGRAPRPWRDIYLTRKLTDEAERSVIEGEASETLEAFKKAGG